MTSILSSLDSRIVHHCIEVSLKNDQDENERAKEKEPTYFDSNLVYSSYVENLFTQAAEIRNDSLTRHVSQGFPAFQRKQGTFE